MQALAKKATPILGSIEVYSMTPQSLMGVGPLECLVHLPILAFYKRKPKRQTVAAQPPGACQRCALPALLGQAWQRQSYKAGAFEA